MTRKNTWAILVIAAALSLPLAACKDTKTLQENDQLKTQVADLQKQNAQAASDLAAMTTARDTLTKENESLKAQLAARKPKRSGKKSSSRRHHRSQTSQ